MTKTILCADDSATMLKVAEITLATSGYRYVGARSADEALQLARSEKPALILADAVMPGKTGYDLCKAIKGDPVLAAVPVLLMCGNSQAFDAARGGEVGADGHVTKPWDTQVMLDRITEVIGKGASPAAPRPASAPAVTAAAPSAPAPVVAKPPSLAMPAITPPRPAVQPPAPVVPTPAATPTLSPAQIAAQAAAAKAQPPRSATIMGMPTLAMPPGMGGAPVVAVPAPSAPVAVPAPPPSAPIAIAVQPAAPQPAAAAPGSAPVVVSQPVPREAAAPRRAVTDLPSAPSRPPMVKGALQRKQAAASARLAEVLERAAGRALPGVDPNSPEMAALLKLSSEVIERVVWEVVPELAEVIIRENLDKLAAR